MLVSGHCLRNEVYVLYSVLLLGHGLKNEVYYMCSVLFLGHGLKNELHYLRSVLVSGHGFPDELFPYFTSQTLSGLRWMLAGALNEQIEAFETFLGSL